MITKGSIYLKVHTHFARRACASRNRRQVPYEGLLTLLLDRLDYCSIRMLVSIRLLHEVPSLCTSPRARVQKEREIFCIVPAPTSVLHNGRARIRAPERTKKGCDCSYVSMPGTRGKALLRIGMVTIAQILILAVSLGLGYLIVRAAGRSKS